MVFTSYKYKKTVHSFLTIITVSSAALAAFASEVEGAVLKVTERFVSFLEVKGLIPEAGLL